MEEIKNYLKENNIPFCERNGYIELRYKSESVYGSKGWLVIRFSSDKFEVEEIAPSCKHYIVCSYGQRYVSTNGQTKGCTSTIDEEIAVKKLSRVLQGYEIVE